MWQTHTQTDGHTPHDGIGRACIAFVEKIAIFGQYLILSRK